MSETIEVIQYNTILRVYGGKLRPAGGEIWDRTEFFSRADISERETVVTSQYLPTLAYIPRHLTVASHDRVVAFDRYYRDWGCGIAPVAVNFYGIWCANTQSTSCMNPKFLMFSS